MFGILADVPECAVAAWLVSGIVAEADYTAAGMDALLQRARAAMHRQPGTGQWALLAPREHIWPLRSTFGHCVAFALRKGD